MTSHRDNRRIIFRLLDFGCRHRFNVTPKSRTGRLETERSLTFVRIRTPDRPAHSQFPVPKCINSTWNKKEMPEEWKQSSLYRVIRRVKKWIAVIIKACCFPQVHTRFHSAVCFKVNSICNKRYYELTVNNIWMTGIKVERNKNMKFIYSIIKID
jgi:hypothetical protein